MSTHWDHESDDARSGRESPTGDEAEDPQYDPTDTGPTLLQYALTRGNLQSAILRMRVIKGAVGVNGLDTD